MNKLKRASGRVVTGFGGTDRDQIMQTLVGPGEEIAFYSKCSEKSSEGIRQGSDTTGLGFLKNYFSCCLKQRLINL